MWMSLAIIFYIWDKVAEDLQFAYDNLPDIWASDKGRVNKWAAAASWQN